MEAGHSVVASLEHLRVGGELHGPPARPAHSHGPHVDQLGAHSTAHCLCVCVRVCVCKQVRRQLIQV